MHFFCGYKWGEIRVVQDVSLWVQSPRKIRPNGAPDSHYLQVELLPCYSSLSDASFRIIRNGYFSPFFLSCEDWSHPIALRSNNATKQLLRAKAQLSYHSFPTMPTSARLSTASSKCCQEPVRVKASGESLQKNHPLPVKSSIYATKKSLFRNSLFRKCYICRI